MVAVSSRPRGRPRSDQAEQAILDATIDELTQRGYLAMTIEGIAARSGVAKSTIYRRWSDIETLSVAAIRQFTVQNEAFPEGPAREVLLELLDRMRRTWANPQYAALMLRVSADGSHSPALYRSCRDKIVGPGIRSLNRAIRQGIDEGLIRDGVELGEVRKLLVSPILAAALTHKSRVTRAQLEFTLDTVLAGLRP